MVLSIRRLLAVVVVVVLTAASAVGQQEPLITRSIGRSDSPYHRLGYNVFAPEVLDPIGGVLSQASVVADPNHPLSLRVPSLNAAEWPGYILVQRGSSQARYSITYEDLVPLALFVEGHGTALFTLHRVPRDFERTAGFIAAERGGHIALEFRGTRFESALHSADICRDCLGDDQPQVVTAINNASARFRASNHIMNNQSTWINVDIGRDVTLSISGEEPNSSLRVNGGIFRFRYDLRKSSTSSGMNEVVILSARMLRSQSDLLTEAERLLQGAWRRGEALREFLTAPPGRADAARLSQLSASAEEFAEEIFRAELARRRADSLRHYPTLWLFDTLAIMRRARDDTPTDFRVFMRQLRDIGSAENYSGAWRRYTRYFCSVYSDDRECQRTSR